ncbi:inositol oxygenase [Halteromyces radiatus]|uniref:inositol oxygenase n=1 Tax=Halteromyces radiatus TaxID=101107 RepID=UPI00221F4C02|nr:inositol oxygenase [Halteromyces radiatus]KAI8086069.1 inositol oxygenase [Halteromyces radiatus]
MRNLNSLFPNTGLVESLQQQGATNWSKSTKPADAFRDYSKADTTQPSIAEFYRLNHIHQTLDHVLAQKKKYCDDEARKTSMGIWQVMEILDKFVDESDPDTELSQIMHSLQSAEAARRDNQPRWMILTSLIHDLGKWLAVCGEPQWTVVGDTFPVGCQFSSKIVYPHYFKENPDSQKYTSKYGIYSPHCGLNNVHMSFGHDEYLYHVCKDYLPKEALYIIRFHSFYSCHTENEYAWLMNEEDHQMMKWVKQFNQYDLYSKAEETPDINQLKSYYLNLIDEFFPETIKW